MILSGAITDFRWDMAALFGHVYMTNGWNHVKVWTGHDDVNAVDAGIGAPVSWSANTVSASGSLLSGVTPGAHSLRYRYVNSITQYPSDPTLPLIFTAYEGSVAGTTAKYSFSNVVPSADPKVDRIAVEMTQAGGEQFFLLTALPNTAAVVTVQTKDDILRTKILSWDDFGHEPPPVMAHIEAFRERLWGLGQYVYSAGAAKISASGRTVLGSGTTWNSAAKGRLLLLSGDRRRFIESVVSSTELLLEESASAQTFRGYKIISEVPDVMRFSKALYAESWPSENQFRVLEGEPENARSIHGFRRDLVIFGERSMERFVYSQDPFLDGSREPVEGNRGAASRRCVQDVDGFLWALDYKGLHRWGGGDPQHVSEAIDPYFDPADRSKGYVDFTYRSKFHSVHNANRHQVWWFVTMADLPGETVYTRPHHAIIYDYLNGTITLAKFDVAMVSSTIIPGTDGTSQTAVVDENGRSWVLGIGVTDGIPTSATKTFTVKSGTTVTSILVSNATLYTSGNRLDGVAAYWHEGDQVRVIQSNSASALVLTFGFSSAPAVGDTVSLGRIPLLWKSKAFTERPSDRRADGRFLHMEYEPKTTGKIRVRFYLDRSATAYDLYVRDFTNQGVTLEADNDYYEVDLSVAKGYAKIPLPSQGSHTVEFEIQVVDAGTDFEMTGFAIDGYWSEEDIEQ